MKRLKFLLFAVVFTLVATAGMQRSWALEGMDFHDHDRQEAEEAQKCVEFEGVDVTLPGESEPRYTVWIGNRCGKRIMALVCTRKEFVYFSEYETDYCGKHTDIPPFGSDEFAEEGATAEEIIDTAFLDSSYYTYFKAIPPHHRAKAVVGDLDYYVGGASMLKRDILQIAACFYPKAPYAPLESSPDGSYYCVDKDKLVFDAGYHPNHFFPDDIQRWREDYLKNEGEFQKRWQEIFNKSCPPSLYRSNPVLPCY